MASLVVEGLKNDLEVLEEVIGQLAANMIVSTVQDILATLLKHKHQQLLWPML